MNRFFVHILQFTTARTKLSQSAVSSRIPTASVFIFNVLVYIVNKMEFKKHPS
jgi:hypothetical protein